MRLHGFVEEEEVAGRPAAALDATAATAQGRPLRRVAMPSWSRGGGVARRLLHSSAGRFEREGAGGEGKAVGTREERERLARLAVRRAVSRGWGTSRGYAAQEGSRGYRGFGEGKSGLV